MSSIHKIHDSLLNRNGKLCTRDDIIKLIQQYNKLFKTNINPVNTLKYMSRKYYIRYIFSGYYYIANQEERINKYISYEDKEIIFMVLNSVFKQWYLGLQSALYANGKILQAPRVLNIITPVFSGKRKILGISIIFSKGKKFMFNGIIQKRTDQGTVYYISPESKTYIDFVYLKKMKKLKRTSQSKKYLKYYPKWVGNR